MIMARRFTCLSIGLSLLVASACGGGGDELEKALQSLSEDDLAIMILPQEAFGDASDGLEVDPDSGFEDSDKVADDTVDPEDTGDDLTDAGFVTAYSLDFEDPTLSALEEGKGILRASSTVDLFEDAAAAAAHLAKQLEDYRRFEGEEIEPGATLEDMEEFVVEGIADDATGLILHVSFGDSDFYATGVVFTVGRLRAGAGITRADDGDVTAEAQRIGRALAERIEAVLLGDIDETPVPIPEKKEDAAEGRAPSKRPFPEEMALSLEDLPEGASIEQERYVEDAETVSSYERQFDVSSVDVGSSRLLVLTSDVALYADAREAAGVMRVWEAGYTGESGQDLFEATIGQNNPEIEISLVAYQIAEAPGLGDERVAIQYSYDSPFGEFAGVIIIFRTGRAVGILSAEALLGDLELADIVSVAKAKAVRMAAALAASP